MEFLNDILDYGFLQRALLVSVIVGVIGGLIGSFIILRSLSLMGDAISHAVLPGIAISFMLEINFFYGAVLAGVLTTVGIGFITEHSRIKNDTSIGIVFAAAFALGIILITEAQTAVDLTQILFGNVLAIRASDMWMTIIVGIIIIVTVFLFYKELLVSSFDPTMAAAYGLPTRAIHYLMMILLTLATVASLQTVGVVLVIAMLITPAATAYLLTNRLSTMIFLAMGFGAISSMIGLYFSFEHNLASGPVIVLVATVFFILAFLFSPKHGLLWRAIRTKRSQTMIK